MTTSAFGGAPRSVATDTRAFSGNRLIVLCSAWIALFALNTLGLLPWLYVKFQNVDLAAVVYDAERLKLGYVPYRDTFTHHFIGYVIPFLVIDYFLPLTPPVLKLVALCFNFATAALVFSIVREVAEERAAWLGAFLTVTVGWFWGWQGFGFNLQSYLNPLQTLIILLVVRSVSRQSSLAFYGAAFCCGLILTFDQRAALFGSLLAVPILFVSAHRKLTTVAVAALAFLSFPGLCAAYLWSTGAWSDFIEQTITFPLFYRNRGITTEGSFGLSWLLMLIFREPFAVVLAAVGAASMWSVERRYWLKVLLTLTLLCSAAYSAAGGRLYSNYLLILAPAVLILITMIPWYARGSVAKRRAALVVLVGLGIFSALKPLILSFRTGSLFVPATESTIEAAAKYLRDHTTLEDGVLVWGFAPQIYVLSDRFRTFRDAGLLSITGGNFSSTATHEQGVLPHMLREFDAYLINTPPRAIVIYRLTTDAVGQCSGKGAMQQNLNFREAPHLATLRDVIARSYRSQLITEGPCDTAEVFVRIDS